MSGLIDVTRAGDSGLSQHKEDRPDNGTHSAEAVTRLSYPVAVLVWITAGLLGWALIAALVFVLA